MYVQIVIINAGFMSRHHMRVLRSGPAAPRSDFLSIEFGKRFALRTYAFVCGANLAYVAPTRDNDCLVFTIATMRPSLPNSQTK